VDITGGEAGGSRTTATHTRPTASADREEHQDPRAQTNSWMWPDRAICSVQGVGGRARAHKHTHTLETTREPGQLKLTWRPSPQRRAGTGWSRRWVMVLASHSYLLRSCADGGGLYVPPLSAICFENIPWELGQWLVIAT
jgi:hypothetical protein